MFHPVLIWLILPLTFAQDDSASGWSRDMPEALRKAFDYRTKPRTGYAKFKTSSRFGTARAIEGVYEQRFAGRSVVNKYSHGAGREDRELITAEDGLTVNRFGDPPRAFGSKRSSPMTPDIRTLGLLPGQFAPVKLADYIKMVTGDGERKFRSRLLGNGMTLVEGRYHDKESGATDEVSWTIDPARDYSIVHISRTMQSPKHNETVQCESQVEVGNFDGFWWPRRVTSQCDSTKLDVDVEVLELEFNRAAHPQEIGPDQLELPVGTEIEISLSPTDEEGMQVLQTHRYVGGNKLEPMGEPSKADPRLKQMQKELDPRLHQVRKDADGKIRIVVNPNIPVGDPHRLGPYLPEPRGSIPFNPDEWEIYVQRWIARYSGEGPTPVKVPLDEKQKAAALAILEDCRKQARPLVERHRSERAEAEKTLEARNAAVVAASRSDSKPSAALVQQLQEAQQRVGKLQRGDPQVEALFEKLKQRLDGLLTASQHLP